MVKATAKNFRASSTLGGRIRMVRKAWGWTQEELAQALGNDRQIVSYWELNKAKPTRAAMQVLAQTLHLSLDALANGDGFSIPDLPGSADKISGLDALRSALLGLVPEGQAATVQGVELPGGPLKAMTIREAKAFIDKSHKAGLNVWVIASPENKE